MRRAGALAIALTAAALVSVVPSSFAEEPITATVLTPRSVFPDDVRLKVSVGDDAVKVEPSRTVVVKFVLQPGAQFPWHSHTGPVVVNVKRGTFVYVAAEGCEHRTYEAGNAFVDLGTHVHTAFNPGPNETAVVATFFNAPAEPASLFIPATAPEDCTL